MECSGEGGGAFPLGSLEEVAFPHFIDCDPPRICPRLLPGEATGRTSLRFRISSICPQPEEATEADWERREEHRTEAVTGAMGAAPVTGRSHPTYEAILDVSLYPRLEDFVKCVVKYVGQQLAHDLPLWRQLRHHVTTSLREILHCWTPSSQGRLFRCLSFGSGVRGRGTCAVHAVVYSYLLLTAHTGERVRIANLSLWDSRTLGASGRALGAMGPLGLRLSYLSSAALSLPVWGLRRCQRPEQLP